MRWRVLFLNLHISIHVHTPIPKQRTDVSKYHNNDSTHALWEMPDDISVAAAGLSPGRFVSRKKRKGGFWRRGGVVGTM